MNIAFLGWDSVALKGGSSAQNFSKNYANKCSVLQSTCFQAKYCLPQSKSHIKNLHLFNARKATSGRCPICQTLQGAFLTHGAECVPEHVTVIEAWPSYLHLNKLFLSFKTCQKMLVYLITHDNLLSQSLFFLLLAVPKHVKETYSSSNAAKAESVFCCFPLTLIYTIACKRLP